MTGERPGASATGKRLVVTGAAGYLARFLWVFPVVPLIRGKTGTPLQLVHEEDVANVMLRVIELETVQELCRLAGRPTTALPVGLLKPLGARGVPRGLVVGLLVAAVVLVGTMVYVVTRSSGAGQGPTSVELGSDGAEIGLEPGATAVAAGTAAAAGSASTGAAAPRAYRPRRPSAPARTSRAFIPDDL